MPLDTLQEVPQLGTTECSALAPVHEPPRAQARRPPQ